VNDKNRFVIFAIDFEISWLKKAKTILIDGTFWSSPNGFTQLITIHSICLENNFILAYILAANKKERNVQNYFFKITRSYQIVTK
jgi:hypothetical protein